MFAKIKNSIGIKNLTAYILFGAIILVFVFFGVTPGRMDGVGGVTGVAANVNGVPISIAEFRERAKNMEEQYRGQIDMFPAAQRQNLIARLRAQALEDLIHFELVSQAAEKSGIRVAPEEIRQSIVSIPVFQNEGRFDRQRYNNYLNYVHTSAAQFEERIKKDLLFNRMRILLAKSLTPTELEVDREKKIMQTKFNVSVGVLDPDAVAKSLPEGQVQAYLAQEANRQKVEEYYQGHKLDYTMDESVRARHILLKFKAGDAASEDAALKKAKELAEKAKTQDFGTLAEAHSEDLPSKAKKGDLGYFTKGRMTPEFERAAFTTAVGKVSEPIKTPFGYHLIKVEDHKPAGERPLAEVEKEVARKLIATVEIDKIRNELAPALKAQNSTEVERLLRRVGAKWEDTGPFEINRDTVPHLGSNEKLIEEAINLKKGQMASEVLGADGRFYVVKLKDVIVGAPETKAKTETAKADSKTGRGQQIAETSEALAARRANYIFNEWAMAAKKTAKIERNESLFMQ